MNGKNVAPLSRETEEFLELWKKFDQFFLRRQTGEPYKVSNLSKKNKKKNHIYNESNKI